MLTRKFYSLFLYVISVHSFALNYYCILTLSNMPRLQLPKRARVAYPCRVCAQECLMEQESIQCDGCECWLHQDCIGMTLAQYVNFSKPHLKFFCRHCISNGDGTGFNFLCSLSRLSALAPNVEDMRAQAESELNLMQFYGITLPDVVPVQAEHLSADEESVKLLKDHSTWLLGKYIPCYVAGDGNCLYRALSLALYGRQDVHTHLRLLTAIEVLLNQSFYDSTSQSYYEPYKVDGSLMLYSYEALLESTITNGSYSDMLTVLALSTVLQKPIQTQWPIVLRDAWESPYTKLVAGRDVQTEI